MCSFRSSTHRVTYRSQRERERKQEREKEREREIVENEDSREPHER